jgi:PAS domain S-box-containing protein
MMDVYPGIDETPMFHTLAQCMTARTSATLATEFVYPDGATAWFELRVQPVPEGLLIMSLDITERKRAADAIESLARFPSENPNPVLRIRQDGHLLYANEASHALLVDWQLVVDQPVPAALQAAVVQTLQEQCSTTIEVEHRQRIIALFIAPVVKVGYANVYGRDITPRKQAEAALRKLNAELEERVAVRTAELQATNRQLQQHEATLWRLNRALKLLSECNQVLVHTEDEQHLLTEICRLIVEVGGYRMAWVGFAEHDPARRVQPVAQLGFEDGYLEHAQIAWDETERGRGPTGAAIRTGAVQVNQDFLTNPAMAPWRESALARGYQSSIALPLKDATATFGALTIYSSWPDAFDTDETGLLTELANDLAYGINALRIRAERQRADEVLHSTTATLQALFDHSPLAIMMLDLDGHIRLWNKAAERMYGWAADEVQGHFLPTVSNETSEEYKAIRDHAARGEPITSMEVERKRKDGSNIWIGLSVAPLRDTTGKIYAQMSIAVDITDRKRADQELYARNRELSILYTISSQATQSLNFEQALDAALTTTLAALDAAAGGIYLWEPGVPTLKLRAHRGLGEWRFGVDRIHPGHSLLGRAIDAHELLVIDLDDYPIDQVPPHVKNSGLHSMVTVPLMSGGVMLGVLIVSTRRSHAFLPADLNMLAAIGRQLGSAIQNAVLYEQTQQELIQRQRAEAELQEINAELETRVAARTGELAAANERLQELDRLKSKFVSDVSHELRTPMTALSLNVDVLEHGQPEKQEQTVQAIRQQAQRVMQLIEDILNLSRLELGADKVQFATVALNRSLRRSSHFISRWRTPGT